MAAGDIKHSASGLNPRMSKDSMFDDMSKIDEEEQREFHEFIQEIVGVSIIFKTILCLLESIFQ